MTSRGQFLLLPRELRDEIYYHYFAVVGGYSYNYTTRKMQQTGGRRININLRLTCKLIAAETGGLPLETNPLHFSAVYQADRNEIFGRFSSQLHGLIELKSSLLLNVTFTGCIDTETISKVATENPLFQSVACQWRTHRLLRSREDECELNVVRSARRAFVISALEKITARPHFAENLVHTAASRDYVLRHAHAISKWYPPWTVPTGDEVREFDFVMDNGCLEVSAGNLRGCWAKQKYRLSAASVALTFLRSLRTTIRHEIRKIVLHEDHVAIAWPESHAQGLIQYCKENSHLRIERHVSLWRNALVGGSSPLISIVHNLNRDGPLPHDTLDAYLISDECFAPWIMEALALPGLDMPHGAFTLVLNSESAPRQAQEIFVIMKQDAALQMAAEICMDPDDRADVSLQRQRLCESVTFIMKGYPEAIEEIMTGRSLVQCDFDTGEPCDVDGLVVNGRGWTARQWRDEWYMRSHVEFDTEEPLPSWTDIRLEDVIL